MIKYRKDLNQIIDISLPVAELGCAEGYFSADILRWGVSLYMVDNWATIAGQKGDGGFDQGWHDKNYQDAMNRVFPYLEKVTILKGLTHEMASRVPDGSLGLLYLDADHSYDGVLRDLESWYPKVKPGEIIAGHDYLAKQYGVNQAVHAFAQTHGIYEVLTIEENKLDDAGFWMRKPK